MTPINRNISPREALALFFRIGFRTTGAKFERRLYKRLWARVHRLNPAVRKKDADRMREQSRRPEVKEADARRHARWYRENRGRVALYNRRYHQDHRARHCHFCGRRAPKGRYGLRPIVRKVWNGAALVDQTVLHCGHC